MFIFTAALSFSEEIPGESFLFIKSQPINADILIDGEPSLQKTPALIRNISGTHTVEIIKDGYAPVSSEINIEAGVPAVFETELAGGTVILSLPDEKKILLRAVKETALPESFRLREGEYSFQRTEDGLEIAPVYPKKDLLTINSTLFFTALGMTAISAAMEIAETGEIIPPHSTRLLISESAAGVLFISELALLIDRMSWENDFRVYKADLGGLESEAGLIYDRAQNALARGNIEEALAGFADLIGSFPDYRRFPEALYKVAKLHIISGDTNLAVSELNIIIDLFPDPEIYDRACQTLALLHFNSGEPEKSRAAVERMVFYDPLFSGTAAELEASGPDQLVRNWAQNPERQAE